VPAAWSIAHRAVIFAIHLYWINYNYAINNNLKPRLKIFNHNLIDEKNNYQNL
jgi:hypothetical protein